MKLGVLLPQPSESWIAGVLAIPSSLEVSAGHHGVGLLPNVACLHVLRVCDSVHFKVSEFSSWKGLLMVFELFQHEMLSKDSFTIYFLFVKNLEELVSPFIRYFVKSMRLLCERLGTIHYLMFEVWSLRAVDG